MTLTEQWRKGELEVGWYYITTTFTDGVLMEWFDGDEFRTVFTCNVKEVLAPVPSYEEWQYLLLDNKILNQCQEIDFGTAYTETVKTKAENQQLKELLKECRDVIETSVWGNCSELTDQIDEVIG